MSDKKWIFELKGHLRIRIFSVTQEKIVNGKCTEAYARALHRVKAPCNIVLTLRKLKTVLPSLKPQIEKHIRSCIVYSFQCPRCEARYVGATTRHLYIRIGEHMCPSQIAGKHFKTCRAKRITTADVQILAATTRKGEYLWTLEALFIRELMPTINTRDEWKSKELTINIKIWVVVTKVTSQHSFYTNALFASLYYDYDESLIIFISHLDNSITDDGSNFEKFLIMNYEVLLAPALIKNTFHWKNVYDRRRKFFSPKVGNIWTLKSTNKYSKTSLNRTPSGTRPRVRFKEVSGL